MEFEGPSAVDYDNVYSLNQAFIALMRRNAVAARCLAALPEALAGRIVDLTTHQVDRLARAPFLLMSFRERDERFWEPVFAGHESGELFAVPAPKSDELGCLVAAGLGFLWQLARQNPYAARLVSGASLHWCEQLTERTFLRIMALAGTQPDILVIRSAARTALWKKLLADGVSRDNQIREAAHISALQCVLTNAALPTGTRWASAACRVKAPLLRVADDHDA